MSQDSYCVICGDWLTNLGNICDDCIREMKEDGRSNPMINNFCINCGEWLEPHHKCESKIKEEKREGKLMMNRVVLVGRLK
ncbi:hypothetical protein AF204_14295 [Listeria monocytogenes]|nr:hypothetical protein [Listeria monocytogenes]EAD7187047.1 hypothetical protein [Listeria monocytogenes]EAE0107917.1 hypothetical protein [Listeria monocytogenes]EAE9715074.1 hypothetical protein [Listeria monocytogenes]